MSSDDAEVRYIVHVHLHYIPPIRDDGSYEAREEARKATKAYFNKLAKENENIGFFEVCGIE